MKKIIYDLENRTSDDRSFMAFCPSKDYQNDLDDYMCENNHTIPEHVRDDLKDEVGPMKASKDPHYAERVEKALSFKVNNRYDLSVPFYEDSE